MSVEGPAEFGTPVLQAGGEGDCLEVEEAQLGSVCAVVCEGQVDGECVCVCVCMCVWGGVEEVR